MFAEAKYKEVLLCGDVAPGDNSPLLFSLSRQTGMWEAINSLQYVEHKPIFLFLILKFVSQRLLVNWRFENMYSNILCFCPAHSGDETAYATVQGRRLSHFRCLLGVRCCRLSFPSTMRANLCWPFQPETHLSMQSSFCQMGKHVGHSLSNEISFFSAYTARIWVESGRISVFQCLWWSKNMAKSFWGFTNA